MNRTIENRRHPRIPVSWPVVLETPQGPVEGKTSNISVGGALILCSEVIEIDGEFQITIKPLDEYEMTVNCKKVWSGDLRINVFQFKGMGVRFTKISAGDYEYIASLVTEQQA